MFVNFDRIERTTGYAIEIMVLIVGELRQNRELERSFFGCVLLSCHCYCCGSFTIVKIYFLFDYWFY